MADGQGPVADLRDTLQAVVDAILAEGRPWILMSVVDGQLEILFRQSGESMSWAETARMLEFATERAYDQAALEA